MLKNLKGDLFGGISAAVVALPVSLAFGAAAGLEPINGLYGAICLGLIAAIIGGTNTLISNPTGPMTVVSALIIAGNIDKFGSIEEAAPTILLIFVLAGALQVVLGLLRFGQYVSYIPDPVISGFMSGIGVIIIILQLRDFFGVTEKYDVLGTIIHIPYMIGHAHWGNAALAALTIVIIYLFPKITKSIPSTLVALISVTTLSLFLPFDLRIIGSIPTEMPTFGIDKLLGIDASMFGAALLPALTLAGLGMIDSLLTAVVADKLTGTYHKPNKELIGQGIGNTVAALFGGIPGAGTTPATVLNIQSGATTRLSGIIHAVFLILIILIGADVAGQIPYAVLSGLLIAVGISIIDIKAFKDFKKNPRPDSIIMLVVLALTVFWSLLYAVAIGLIFAALYFMKAMADVVEQQTSNNKIDRIIDDILHSFNNYEEFKSKVRIKNLNGPLFFGFASRFQQRIDAIPEEFKVMVFNFSNVPYIDQSGLQTLTDALIKLKKRDMNVCLSEVNEDILTLFRKKKIIPIFIDEDHVFSSVEGCVMWLNEPGHMDNDFVQDDQLYLPTAYTPNGDGINDEWQIRNIGNFPNCVVKIYNSDSNLVFESIGYKEEWDGMKDGKLLPVGKYTYHIDLLNDGSDIREGDVHVFR